jgi:hypothetical protein
MDYGELFRDNFLMHKSPRFKDELCHVLESKYLFEQKIDHRVLNERFRTSNAEIFLFKRKMRV